MLAPQSRDLVTWFHPPGLRSLDEPIAGYQAEQSRVESELSRAEPRDKPRRADRAELQPQQRDPSQPRASSQARVNPSKSTSWAALRAKLRLEQSCAGPPTWAKPTARSVLRSRLRQDERSPEPTPSWVGIEPIPEPGRVRTKPSGIRDPSLEQSWAEYRASSLVRTEPIHELRRVKI